MSNTNLDEELFRVPFTEFKNHIEIPDNDRILFSGRFGIGKTTFLDWFFKQEEIAKDYKVIRLYPVNYSVSSNEDIFKYIKMDILIELLKDPTLNFDHFNLSTEMLFPNLVSDNSPELFITSILMFMEAKEMKLLAPIVKNLGKLLEKLKEYKKTCETKLSDILQVKDFALSLIQKEGSQYEFNFISEIIVKLIAQLKETRKIVLVIDDLDRIDPHHVFRVFNIFAAHFDHPTTTEEKNKFGFDKVVLVGDIANLRIIFHHFYGTNVDFSGYIDKFYSNGIFYFNNFKSIYDAVQKRVEKSNFSFKMGNQLVNLTDLINSDYKKDITQFITAFALVGRISLRNLKEKNVVTTDRLVTLKDNVHESQLLFVIKANFLANLLGNINIFKDCLHAANDQLGKTYHIRYYDELLKEVLPVFCLDNNLNTRDQKLVTINGVPISFAIGRDKNSYVGTSVSISDRTDSKALFDLGPTIFIAYLNGIEHLERLGYWK